MKSLTVLLLGLAQAMALAAPSWQEAAALRDSLALVHPRMRASWLKERGIRDEYWQGCVLPTDSGLRVVGRWSFGPSYDVDGRVTSTETLVALARGSGVSLIRFSRAESLRLELLSDVNAGGLMKRVAVRDTLLYVGSTAGLEIWSISDERSPRQLSWLHTALNDFDMQDSFAYVIGPDDSFKVYNVSNAANPVFRGACRDSGTSISVCGGYAYIGDRWGMYVIDARNPASPSRVASWGSCIQGVRARGNICCATTDNPNNPGELRFTILDVRMPSSPAPLGSLNGAGGYDTQFDDTLAFISGYYTGGHEFQVLSIADSLHPRLVGEASTLGYNWGVWGDGRTGLALVADMAEGMQVFDITVPGNPTLDTTVLAAGSSHDVAVRGNLMAVANEWCGMKLIGIADPARPVEVSSIDSFYEFPATHAVVLQDSFAFMGRDLTPYLRTVWVGDSSRPQTVGGCPGVQTLPEDMVLMDTLLYIVGRLRFNIVNVARPREPVLVGSCVIQDGVFGLVVQETLAYVAGVSLQVLNVADPSSPRVISSGGRPSIGVAVNDTFAYIPSFDTLFVYSVANPSQPCMLSATPTGRSWDVALGDSLLFVGTGTGVEAYDIGNPVEPRRIGAATAPYSNRRLCYAGRHLHAALWEAGVAIYETTSTAVGEPAATRPQPQTFHVWPSVAAGNVRCALSGLVRNSDIAVYDITGVKLRSVPLQANMKGGATEGEVSLAGLPAGVYVVRVDSEGTNLTAKAVKTKGR